MTSPAPVTPSGQDSTLVGILRATIASHPDAVAIDVGGVVLTYAQLGSVIDEQVARLHRLGIGRGDRVGIRVPAGTMALYVAIASTLCAGAAYVPVDSHDAGERVRTVWEDADVDAVYGRDLTVDIRRTRDSSPDTSAPRPSDDSWVISPGDAGSGGVAITHRALANWIHTQSTRSFATVPLGPGDRVMTAMSVAAGASGAEIWLTWRNGATLVPAPLDALRATDTLGAWILNRGITLVATSPAYAASWPAAVLDAVRLFIIRDTDCPAECVEQLRRPGPKAGSPGGPAFHQFFTPGQPAGLRRARPSRRNTAGDLPT